MKRKLYFLNEDAENCYTEAYFQKMMVEEGLDEISVFTAVKSPEKEYIYCRAVDACGESGECGKSCSDYEPRNGKNGCCRHRSAIYEWGEEVTLKRKDLKGSKEVKDIKD